MNLNDALSIFLPSVSKPQDLDNIEAVLDFNRYKGETLFDAKKAKELISYMWQHVICDTFDEAVIRKAFSMGLFPMSFEKRVLDLEDFSRFSCYSFGTKNKPPYYRDVLFIRHHDEKLIIRPDDFGYPHKVKRYIRQQFADYTLCFNRDFSQCVDRLMNAYHPNWIIPPLVEQFKRINEQPDAQVAVVSVELWKDDELVAGELGFVNRNSYASLSGFHTEPNSGTVQMAILGEVLFDLGFAYWDLGMLMDYKMAYHPIVADRAIQRSMFAGLAPSRIELPKSPIRVGDVVLKALQRNSRQNEGF